MQKLWLEARQRVRRMTGVKTKKHLSPVDNSRLFVDYRCLVERLSEACGFWGYTRRKRNTARMTPKARITKSVSGGRDSLLARMVGGWDSVMTGWIREWDWIFRIRFLR